MALPDHFADGEAEPFHRRGFDFVGFVENGHLGVADGRRLAEDVELAPGEVEHPILGDACLGVGALFFTDVVGEAGCGEFDDEQCVARAGVGGAVAAFAQLENGKIGLRLGVVVEADGQPVG